MKSVRLLAADAPEAASYGVSQRLTVNARAAGPRLGKDVQQAIKGSKSGDWSVADDGTVTAGGLALDEGEYTLETVAGSAGDADAVGVLPTGGFVVLDTEVTPELAAEGLARDLVRAVQQARRDAGLDVSDRIALTVAGSDAVQAAARTHEQLITARDPGDVVRRVGATAAGTEVTVGDGEKARGLCARRPDATTAHRALRDVRRPGTCCRARLRCGGLDKLDQRWAGPIASRRSGAASRPGGAARSERGAGPRRSRRAGAATRSGRGWRRPGCCRTRSGSRER